jgi:hypothetical protein
LSSDFKNKILTTQSSEYYYTCLPTGGSGTDIVAREILISFYDENGNNINADIHKEVTFINEV